MIYFFHTGFNLNTNNKCYVFSEDSLSQDYVIFTR